MILVPNEKVVVPLVSKLVVSAAGHSKSDFRGEHRWVGIIDTQGRVNLPFVPLSEQWIQVYVEGQVVYNMEWERQFYMLDSNTIQFAQHYANKSVLIIVDTKDDVPSWATIIPFTNIQGAKRNALAMEYYAATWCEPIIITQPVNGWVRLTSDRASLGYVPNTGFRGNDAFAFSLISQRGQIGMTVCVDVVVK